MPKMIRSDKREITDKRKIKEGKTKTKTKPRTAESFNQKLFQIV